MDFIHHIKIDKTVTNNFTSFIKLLLINKTNDSVKIIFTTALFTMANENLQMILKTREQGCMTTHSSRALTLLDNTSGIITYSNITNLNDYQAN